MNNNDKLKEILTSMNTSQLPLDSFFELLQKDTGSRMKFSSYKNYLDRCYENINKGK